MSFNEIKKTISEQQKEIAEIRTKFKEAFKSQFKDITKQFFEENPEIKCITWSQFTPYFNDGEPCVFGVGEVKFLKKFDKEEKLNSDEYEFDDDYVDFVVDTGSLAFDLEWAQKQYDRYKDSEYEQTAQNYKEEINRIKNASEREKELYENCVSFEELIQSNEDMMEEIFDDHVSVYITPDEIIVEGYDHD